MIADRVDDEDLTQSGREFGSPVVAGVQIIIVSVLVRYPQLAE